MVVIGSMKFRVPVIFANIHVAVVHSQARQYKGGETVVKGEKIPPPLYTVPLVCVWWYSMYMYVLPDVQCSHHFWASPESSGGVTEI